MRKHRNTLLSALAVLVLAVIGTVAYVIVKLDVFAPSLSEQVRKVEQADGSWWLGRTFEGMRITLASPAGGERVDDLGYGPCKRSGGKLDPFTTTRCGYPLLLQVRKRKYAVSLDDLPTRLDGSCVRTTVRGAPVVVGPDGAILYTGDLAIAVLGRPEQVGRALARVRPVRGRARLAPPTLGVDALSNCVVDRAPFTPLATRIAELRESPGLPLAWVGQWYAGGRLTSAGRVGRTSVLGYASCGKSSDLGSCLETLAVSTNPLDVGQARETLRGSECRTFRVGRAQGVVWRKDLAGETGGGVIVFTGDSTISLANDITLESIPMSRLTAAARLVRPLPPAQTLPPPSYPVKRLLAGCAQRSPV